jgi:hypothetical protein
MTKWGYFSKLSTFIVKMPLPSSLPQDGEKMVGVIPMLRSIREGMRVFILLKHSWTIVRHPGNHE